MDVEPPWSAADEGVFNTTAGVEKSPPGSAVPSIVESFLVTSCPSIKASAFIAWTSERRAAAAAASSSPSVLPSRYPSTGYTDTRDRSSASLFGNSQMSWLVLPKHVSLVVAMDAVGIGLGRDDSVN